MNYTDNITLSIYIKLLMGDDVSFNRLNSEDRRQLNSFASTLDSNFRIDTSSMTIEEEESYNDSYQPVIVYKKDAFGVHISCQNKSKLRDFLKEYSNLYYEGELIENDNIHESFDTLKKELIEATKNIKTNKKRYILEKTKFTPLILYNYFKNKNFIKALSIELAREGTVSYHPMELYYTDCMGEFIRADNWQNYFICQYTLDMEWYLNKFNNPISETVNVKRRTTYPKQQQKLFDVITNWVSVEKSYKISPDSLFSRAKLKLKKPNRDMAISRLNKCYKEINNTDTKLLKKNKGTEYYEISRDFQFDIEN